MASKFQNRLVGTIVLVALGVIILPGLLDGQKKHYQDEFAAIPLVPKPGDRDEPDMLPAELPISYGGALHRVPRLFPPPPSLISLVSPKSSSMRTLPPPRPKASVR